MQKNIEEAVRANIDFYRGIVELVGGASCITSEIKKSDEYQGGPGDDVVSEHIVFRNIYDELERRLELIEHDEHNEHDSPALTQHTKRLCLVEIAKYCVGVASHKALTEEELRAHSSQENPTISRAGYFENYQKKVEGLYQRVEQLLAKDGKSQS